jgi:hypothetical protein
MKYILSTMTNSISYNWYETIGDLPRKKHGVLIHGGAGLPSIRSGFGDQTQDKEGMPIWTAKGIVTSITEEQYDRLKDHWLFKQHLEGGWVKVLNSDISGNHKAVKEIVRDMNQRDDFAQLTPETFKTKVKVKTPLELEQETQFRI